MATLYTRTIGSVSDAYISGGTGTITLKLVCTYTQTAQNNSSYVSIYVRAEVSNSSIDYKIGSWQITGNGPTGSGGETTIQSGTRNMTTKSKTISHLSNGAQTFSSGAKVTMTYFYGLGKSKDVSFTLSNKSYALATINVYSSLSFTPSTPEMASAVTIGITKPSTSAFTATSAKITATYDDNTYTIYEGSAASYSWTIPDLAATTPNSTTKTIAIKVQSIRSGTTYSAKEYSLNVTVPAAYVPTCAFNTITDEYGFSSFIANYSHLTIALKSGTAGSGASIVSYSIEVRDTNASGSLLYSATNTTTASTTSFTMPDAIISSATYIKATITDSRGRTGTITQTVSAVAYQQPQITLTAERCQSDGTADPMGAYAKVVCTWSITQISTDNQISGTIDILKSTNGTSYTTIKQQSVSANTYSGSFNVVTALAAATQGWFYVTIADSISSITSVIKNVPKAILPLSLYDNGTNVGASIGQMSSEKGFHVYLETEHRNHFVAPQISAGNTSVGGYTVLCTFTITGNNINQPVYLRVICRNRWYPYDISIRWWNEANTDPGFAYMFASSRYDLFYMYKVSTSTWQLLIYNQLTYENFAISDVQIGGYNSSKITVDYPASTYAAATVYPTLPGVLDTDVFASKSWSEFSARANAFDGIDVNTMTQAGCYSISNGVNTPTGSPHGMLIVIENTATNIKQIFMGTTTLDCYRMTYDGGSTWYGWYEYDVIVAEGTSGNWRYRKYASGKSECWKNVIGNVAITKAYSGGFYRSAAIGAEDFPSGLFIQNPSVLATVSNNNGVSIFCSGVQYQSNTRMDGVFNIHVGSGTYSCINAFYVVGKWK